MRKHSLFILTLLGLFFLWPAVSKADSGNQGYFSVLPDIPMMAGMDEVEDQTFAFDKAEGKVAETTGFLADSTPEKLQGFYRDVLAQLGWKPLKNGVFTRNNERLTVKFEGVATGALVRFQLAPLSR